MNNILLKSISFKNDSFLIDSTPSKNFEIFPGNFTKTSIKIKYIQQKLFWKSKLLQKMNSINFLRKLLFDRVKDGRRCKALGSIDASQTHRSDYQ